MGHQRPKKPPTNAFFDKFLFWQKIVAISFAGGFKALII
jgi:hypothetical protein